MRAADFFDAFRKNVESDPEFYRRDYIEVKEKVRQSSAWYKGEPVKFLYQPMFFTGEDIERFKYVSSTLAGILEKVVDEYIKNPDFRELFGFPKLMEELILADPGYDFKFPIARFDIFYPYGDDIKFCELNADGSSSMNESRELHRIFKDSGALRGIADKDRFFDYELFDSLIDAILQNYSQFKGKKADVPSVAIVDFEGEGIISEFKVFRERFERRGYPTIICDPRQLKYTQGHLYFKDRRIDLVYRRATTARLVEEAEHITDFIKAYRDGAVCVVGGLVSQIIHNKKIFAVLHDFENLHFLSEDEKEFIREHIPYTRILDPTDRELLENVVENKDGFILKPCDRYAANGVMPGRDFTLPAWREAVKEAAADGCYLVQEFCAVPRLAMLTIEDESMYFEDYGYIIGLFMYNHRFSGIYTRAGRKSIIASVAESFTLPNFVLGSDR